MKADLLKVVDEVIGLLMECDFDDKAAWFRERSVAISQAEEGSGRLREECQAIKKVLGGMGSFSDLPLYPRSGSGLSAQQARARQWELTERLGDIISRECATS